MKKAAGYIRISDEDQSNFSIEGQKRYILKWAERNDFEVVEIFVDEGKSAKNFDRPDWKRLEAFLKEKHKEIDSLVFIKYDRFSRNMREALNKVEEIEIKYKISLEAALEPIGLSRFHPDYFRRRAQYLLDAEAEWHRIRDRTKMGIYEAHMQGRYCSSAPYGYLNVRDEKDKPKMIPDPKKSLIVKEIFEDFLSGDPFDVIRKKAKQKGFTGQANGYIQRILKNPLYAGLIKTVQYRDEPSMLVKGTHEPIISEDTYYKAQKKLLPKYQFKTIVSEEFPLRGIVHCPECGKPFTGAKSKGKYQLFPYYKCNYHGGHNHNATRMNGQMAEIFDLLSLQPSYIDFIRAQIIENLKEANESGEEEIKQLNKNKRLIEGKIENLESDYISRKIDPDMFQRWHPKLKADLAETNDRLKLLTGSMVDYDRLIEEQIYRLGCLGEVYESAKAVEKQDLITTVFDRKISYLGGLYRTPHIYPLFSDKAVVLSEKKLLVLEQPLQNSQMCPTGELNRTLNHLEIIRRLVG